ncbi:MAG: hypothetical protein AAB468_00965 [Patescibacteria group bacterium]
MVSDKLQAIVQTLKALPSFSAFVADHLPHRFAKTEAEAREHHADIMESQLVVAAYKSLATEEGVVWSSCGECRSCLKKEVEEMAPLVEEFGRVGIEITFSKPVHQSVEAEDKRSGGDWWAIFLTAQRKS